ncbi:MAG: 23S rRNA (guanosine(2251)-2'-O)-methyltransferase RlmB [Eubacteriales bacterium]|nr:23S rRNA (guanosine(2251)-2'-O)-methyltransferase RlmB [Eubacteriales bacterium]
MENNELIEGRNPVWEALKSGRPIEKILLAKTINQQDVAGITALARRSRIKLEWAPKEKLDQLSVTKRHQGVLAVAAVREYADLDTELQRVLESGELPFIVVLDEIEDPHNLGAIIRTAECMGAQFIVIPERRSAGLTAAVERASAGAVEHVPVCRVTNLVRAIDTLKQAGIWIMGADMNGKPAYETDFAQPLALVIGSEGEGMRRLVREACDGIVSLPMSGKTGSLNASVAAGALMYEVVRQRMSICSVSS